MADYYSILGLQKDASIIEIKSAFRKLAKIYHPDKNPNKQNAKVLFENILLAYTVLSNPAKKRRYDYLLANSSQPAQRTGTQNRNKSQKNWDVSPEDLKQRQYYQNYYKAKQKASNLKSPGKVYTDYKCVLFATPLAVGLLLLIVSMFSPSPKTQKPIIKEAPIIENLKKTIVNGDKPYSGFFGEAQSFNSTNILKINNSSSFDAVVVLFGVENNNYIQHAYLQNGYLVEFNFLPNEGVYWKCLIGKNWNENKKTFNNKVIGCFDSIVQFQNWKQQPVFFNKGQGEVIEFFDIINSKSKNKNYISNEFEFFEN